MPMISVRKYFIYCFINVQLVATRCGAIMAKITEWKWPITMIKTHTHTQSVLYLTVNWTLEGYALCEWRVVFVWDKLSVICTWFQVKTNVKEKNNLFSFQWTDSNVQMYIFGRFCLISGCHFFIHFLIYRILSIWSKTVKIIAQSKFRVSKINVENEIDNLLFLFRLGQFQI